MPSANNIVIQTAAVVANHLKPLIDEGICKITRHEEQLIFVMGRGSATIAVRVLEHPSIEEEALVEVNGALATVNPDKLDIGVLIAALSLNNRLNGYAIALDEEMGMLCLRGTLIGSTMDDLEFNHLLESLSQAADELDDKFVAALSAVTPQTGTEDTKNVIENLKQMASKIQAVITEKEEVLVGEFVKTLSENEQTEFANLIKDAEIHEAVREIALGSPVSGLVTLLITEDLTDEERRRMGQNILKSLPDNQLLLKMIFFTMAATAKMVAEAIGMDLAVVQARIPKMFEQN